MRGKPSVAILLCLTGLTGCSSASDYQQTPSKMGDYKIVSCTDQASAYTKASELKYDFRNTSSAGETVMPVVYDNHAPVNNNWNITAQDRSGPASTNLAFTVDAGQTVSQILYINSGDSSFCEDDPAIDVITPAPSVPPQVDPGFQN